MIGKREENHEENCAHLCSACAGLSINSSPQNHLPAWQMQVSRHPTVVLSREWAAKPAQQIPLGVEATGAQLLWSQGFRGQNIMVGVIDIGIHPHPDFQNRVKIRRNYTGESGLPKEIHGTHVAGTIGANGGVKGVAPQVLLADYRVLGNDGSGTNEAITKAIRDAVEDGCDVINMSLGGPYPNPPMRAAIRYAVACGVVVVCAAGNDGDGDVATNEFSWPAMNPETLSVGAVQFRKGSPNTVRAAYFSSSNREVDVCAPGVGVESTGNDGGYLVLDGTSMATPHVVGMMALLIQKSRQGNNYDTTYDFYKQLRGLAKDIGLPGWDHQYGHGFVTFNPTI